MNGLIPIYLIKIETEKIRLEFCRQPSVYKFLKQYNNLTNRSVCRVLIEGGRVCPFIHKNPG